MDAALRSAAQHEEATDQADQAAAGEYDSHAPQTGTHVPIDESGFLSSAYSMLRTLRVRNNVPVQGSNLDASAFSRQVYAYRQSRQCGSSKAPPQHHRNRRGGMTEYTTTTLTGGHYLYEVYKA